MRWIFVVSLSILALLLADLGEIAAQGTGSSSSNLFTNNRTTSTSGGANSLFGGGTGSGSGLGNGQGGVGMMTNPNGVGGQARQANSFIGANTAQGSQQGFVGAAQANASGAGQYGSSGMGMGGGGYGMGQGGMGMGGMGNGGRRSGMGGYGSGMNGNNNMTAAPQMRTTLRLGGDLGKAQVSTEIGAHLGALPALHWQLPAQVEVQGRTVILRGVVSTEHDRELAERVVLLEPRVAKVQNLIVVASAAAVTTPAGQSSAAGSSAPAPVQGSPAPAGYSAKPGAN